MATTNNNLNEMKIDLVLKEMALMGKVNANGFNDCSQKLPKYKITYLHHLMCCAFVRVADDAILYSNSDENLVRAFADGFTTAKNCKYYVE